MTSWDCNKRLKAMPDDATKGTVKNNDWITSNDTTTVNKELQSHQKLRWSWEGMLTDRLTVCMKINTAIETRRKSTVRRD